MKVIIAQGNPEDKYSNTRHNIGFLALNYFVNKKIQCFITSTEDLGIEGKKFIVEKGKIINE